MWNPFKIFKYSKSVFESTGEERTEFIQDNNGEARLEEVQGLYREMLFPSNIKVWRKLTSTHAGRQIIWGFGFNDKERVEQNVIPKLADREWLQSLPPNTWGAHLGHLFKNWELSELYDKRFLESEATPDGGLQFMAATDEMRANISRHGFLFHDLLHCLFRYDTSPMGEACIQAVTNKGIGHFAMKWVGFVVTCRIAWRNKSWTPFKVYREALRLGKRAADKGLMLHGHLDYLEMDIAEVREKFDVGVPVEYKKWAEEHPQDFRHDVLHPEYNDVEWDTTEVTV